MSRVNFKPLEDRVLVKTSAADTKTQSGIHIPDSAQEKPQKGIIVAVGPGRKKKGIPLKEGDEILFEKLAGVKIHIDEKEYLIMRSSDVFGIINAK